MAQIGIIDYGCGNIRSVAEAFEYLGHQTRIFQNTSGIEDSSHLILPGVGVFEMASRNLRDMGFAEKITTHVKEGKMFLGICVGMQVLMERGHEFGTHEGLSLIKGESVHLSNLPNPMEECPHIGWSSVQFSGNNPFKTDDEAAPHFYFNHSFACLPENKNITIASLAENDSLSVIVKQDNIIGIQCHPEKSHVAGLRFLSQFADMG